MNIHKPVIWMASEYWDPSLVQASYHITKELSKQTPVLFCNSIGIRRPALAKSEFLKGYSKLVNYSKGVQKIQSNLWVISPIGLPLSLGDWTYYVNTKIVANQIYKSTRKIGFLPEDALLWISFPGWLPVVKEMNIYSEQIVIHFFDRWEAFSRIDKRIIHNNKNELINMSGAVLASSMDIVSELKSQYPNVYHTPHGVEVDLFMEDQTVAIPQEMDKISSPIVGFWGTINSFWIDFNLICQCAMIRPDISWVYIGNAGYISDIDQPIVATLKQIPNIHFLGKKNFSDLPTYGKHFDVGLLPFKDTELTRSASPLKLLEYLALGLPVISTIPQQYGILDSYVEVAGSDPNKYLDAVVRALDQNKSDREAREKIASRFSWNKMVEGYINSLENAGISF